MQDTLDTNLKGDATTELTLTTEIWVTMTVTPLSGDHHNHKVALEQSPDDGVSWVPLSDRVNGNANCVTVPLVATRVRACVAEAEGSTSTVTVHIIAR